jgi:hypothetical protein
MSIRNDCLIGMSKAFTTLMKSERATMCLEHRERLGGDQQAVLVEPVGHDAPDRRQDERPDLGAEADEAQQERRARQGVDEPGEGDLLDPRADERDPLAAHEEPIVAGSERPQQAVSRSASVAGRR